MKNTATSTDKNSRPNSARSGGGAKKKSGASSSADRASTMDAIALLKHQHREVEALFEELESHDESVDKVAIFKEIADSLAMHASIEEMHFYPAVREKRTEDILLESLEEHLGIKRVIADLLKTSGSEDTFSAKLKVLQEQVEHHVEEEEQDLFPKVKKIFKQDELLSLGQLMEREFTQMIGTDARKKVPAETKEAAALS